MDAWFVIDPSADYGVFVWAETRGRAKQIAIKELNYYSWDFLVVKSTRYQALDRADASEGAIPKETCFHAGCHWTCEECDGSTGGSGYLVDGQILCDECGSLPCSACDGNGYIERDDADVDCEVCEGRGIVARDVEAAA